MRSARRKTALVTGATGGIGSAFADRLARDGFDLVLTDRVASSLEEAAASLEQAHGVQVQRWRADLVDPADVHGLVGRIRSGTVPDMLVNVAGFGTNQPFEENDLEVHLRMIQVHISACVSLTWAALPGMIARGSGDIINIGSLASFLPVNRDVNYAATKSYVVAFSEQLQPHLRGTGVHVLAVCPGLTRTGFHDTREFGGLGETRPFERMWSTPEDVADRSLRALRRKKVIYTPGVINTLVRWVGSSHIVRWLGRRVFTVRGRASS